MVGRFLIIFCLFFLTFTSVYSDYSELLLNDKQKPIKEIMGDLNGLNEEKNNLNLKIEELGLEGNLANYLIPNLTQADINAISSYLKTYNDTKIKLETELVDTSKRLEDIGGITKELLANMQRFYEEILPFINRSNYGEYLNYITLETENYITKLELDASIIRKNEIVTEKLVVIEEKIKEHKEYMDETLGVLINEQIEERISRITSNPEYTQMSIEARINIFTNTIEKLKIMKNDFDISKNTLGVNDSIKATSEKKMVIITLVIERFEAEVKELEKLLNLP